MINLAFRFIKRFFALQKSKTLSISKGWNESQNAVCQDGLWCYKKGTLPMTAFLATINKQFIFARLAAIALFAGLFILSACGGTPVAVNVTLSTPPDRPDAPDGPCDADVFSKDCGLLGEPAQVIALNACRNKVQTNPADTCDANIPPAAVACFKDPFNEEC
ncbi:MAG: hypothetical protein K0U16_06960, partial [Gammaproteobacteria bacterium]|nr:hypothetical protein [Gammaproteobacteria bacterium]